ncbi:MAG: polyprenyl synthetase family protein [Rhodobacteraceae bacterium]|nr:polyprenyl synthetase family protein [Paracoccaceae bacterium]
MSSLAGPRLSRRIEAALDRALARAGGADAPPRLAEAMVHAVVPGGARIRPTILLSVARACGDDRPEISDAAAAALELIHCASLVHDDMPCFDDADTRRGKPSVHRAYGEALALLAGDSLIILAFEELARAALLAPERGAQLMMILARTSGMPGGICAGQGWESEPRIDLAAYHRAKTAALFVAATQMGAAAAGAEPEAWPDLGARIGEAFQVADDLRDALGDADALGKPVGQDLRNGRPNAVQALGVEGAVRRLEDSLSGAIASIPSCPGEAELCALVRLTARKLVPVLPVRTTA